MSVVLVMKAVVLVVLGALLSNSHAAWEGFDSPLPSGVSSELARSQT